MAQALMDKRQLSYWLLLTAALVASIFLLLSGADFTVMHYSLTDADISQVAWNTDHFAYCLRHFKNPYYTDVLFQPQGEKLVMHTYTQFFGLINVFVNDIPLAVNIGLLINFIAAATGFFLLGLRFYLNALQCLALALFACFNYYTLNKLGLHLNLVCIWVFPFAIMAWLDIKGFSFREKLRSGKLFLFLILLFLAWICDFYVIFYILSFAALHLIYLGAKELIRRARIKGWQVVLAVALLFIFSHIISRQLWVNGFSNKGGIWGSADIRLLFTPGGDGRFLQGDLSSFSRILEFENYVFLGYFLGLTLLVALIYKLWYRINTYASFLLFLCVAYLLIIFPDFRVNENHLFFTPLSLTHYIPFVDQMRSPARFMEMLFVFVPLFVFFIINNCHVKLGILKTLMPLLLFAVSLIEFMPAKLKSYDVNGRIAAAMVKTQLKDVSVLQIPFCRGDGMQCFGIYNQDDYFFQIANRCKIWGGYIARMSDRTISATATDPFIQQILNVQDSNSYRDKPIPPFSFHKQQRPACIVVDKQAMPNHGKILFWLKISGWNKRFEDDRYILFNILISRIQEPHPVFGF